MCNSSPGPSRRLPGPVVSRRRPMLATMPWLPSLLPTPVGHRCHRSSAMSLFSKLQGLPGQCPPPPSLACPDDAKFEPPSGNSIGAFPRPPAVLSPDPCRSSSYLASQAMPVLGPHAPVLSCLAARGRTRLLSHSIRHSNLYSMHPGSFFSTFTLFQPGPGELILHSFPSGPVLSRPFCPRSTRTDPQPRCLGPD